MSSSGIYKPSSYFTGDILLLRYRAQPVNAMYDLRFSRQRLWHSRRRHSKSLPCPVTCVCNKRAPVAVDQCSGPDVFMAQQYLRNIVSKERINTVYVRSVTSDWNCARREGGGRSCKTP
jgi:hypothetical protein